MMAFTPLHYASRCFHLYTIHLLLKRGSQIDAEDLNGLTPLHHACMLGLAAEVAEMLLDKGCQIDNPAHDGYTPFLRAVHHDRIDVLELLLRAGCQGDFRDKFGQTALHYAAGLNIYQSLNFYHIVKLLVERGCDVKRSRQS